MRHLFFLVAGWTDMAKSQSSSPPPGRCYRQCTTREDEVTSSAMDRLVAIMARLRDPSTAARGTWRRPGRRSRPYTIEEAYEVADAIARDDAADLKDELGDLLLQVVFHSRIAEDAGTFTLDDVAAAVSDKMERRHPLYSAAPMRRRAGKRSRPRTGRPKRYQCACRRRGGPARADARGEVAEPPPGSASTGGRRRRIGQGA